MSAKEADLLAYCIAVDWVIELLVDHLFSSELKAD